MQNVLMYLAVPIIIAVVLEALSLRLLPADQFMILDILLFIVDIAWLIDLDQSASR